MFDLIIWPAGGGLRLKRLDNPVYPVRALVDVGVADGSGFWAFLDHGSVPLKASPPAGPLSQALR